MLDCQLAKVGVIGKLGSEREKEHWVFDNYVQLVN